MLYNIKLHNAGKPMFVPTPIASGNTMPEVAHDPIVPEPGAVLRWTPCGGTARDLRVRDLPRSGPFKAIRRAPFSAHSPFPGPLILWSAHVWSAHDAMGKRQPLFFGAYSKPGGPGFAADHAGSSGSIPSPGPGSVGTAWGYCPMVMACTSGISLSPFSRSCSPARVRMTCPAYRSVHYPVWRYVP